MFTPLPEEQAIQVSWRRVILTLLVPVVALAGINALLMRFPVSLDFRVSARKWALTERAGTDLGTLVLGDSTGNLGVDPALLEQAFGGKALNLCTYGELRAVDDAWMLQEVLRRGGRPRRVLIVHAYDTWRGDLDPSLTTPYPLERIFRLHYQPELDINLGARSQLLFERYFPLYGQSAVLKQVLRDPLWLKRWNVDIYSPDGFIPYNKPARPSFVVQDAQSHLRRLEADHRIISPINETSLEVLADLADQYGFDAYIATGPLYEGLARSPEFISYHETLRQRFEEICKGHSRIHYLTPEPISFPATRMHNADHVVAEATDDYTRQLIELIRNMEPSSEKRVLNRTQQR